jgi:hypothetical protein
MKKKVSNRKVIIAVWIISISLLILSIILGFNYNSNYDGLPVAISMLLPNNLEIEIGNSRVAEVVFYSGYDDRTKSNFKIVQKK